MDGMNHDAFERFESSRRGWLIPVALFLLGAVATLFAIDAVMDVAMKQMQAASDQQQAAEAGGENTAANAALPVANPAGDFERSSSPTSEPSSTEP